LGSEASHESEPRSTALGQDRFLDTNLQNLVLTAAVRADNMLLQGTEVAQQNERRKSSVRTNSGWYR
jgi:hypothetical protein